MASTIYSVVKIFSINRTADPSHPWTAPTSNPCSGSGFVISGRRIITNAHVVTGATFIQATKLSSGTKYKATVLAFGHECDLAILLINNNEFWKDLEPLNLRGEMPNLLEPVRIVGYPQGGDSISITGGILSRINTYVYSHSRGELELPVLQVDAAINSGNSGGPVFIENEVIGVAFERLPSGDNIGYVIPAQIVKIFLASIDKGDETGFCSLGISLQSMENAMMRKYFKMKKIMTGVLVTKTNQHSQGNEYVEKNDVILEIDGMTVEDDGKVFYESRLWMHLNGFIALKNPNERISLKVLRNGEVIHMKMEAMPVDTWYTSDYSSPSYYILAGLVFTESTESMTGVKICEVLEDNINKGYSSFRDLEVHCVNGRPVNTLDQLCELIVASTEEYVRIELEGDLVVMVNLKSHKKSRGQLLESHRVMYDMSDDIEEAYPCLGEE
ncbi:hypothetical protein ARALYDRAFT_920262 [Arabidopsis lyrata subsp. lyrata]|uniref:PDZ domain-containing protein n=2 Tax=Arabidopsis lyrata subsp. lyrata TaxID=81972 RepID=D7MWM9_ARALL|nr:hypothetical protein ARALYDRAFT_920262 [Arabidopsis lyrata subsp. lyrata]